MTDSISIAKGSLMVISIRAINRSSAIWGPDAKEFKPDRWLTEDGISGKAKEVQGHRHLLTFVDGPRTCLGKDFAIAEFKVIELNQPVWMLLTPCEIGGIVDSGEELCF
jgi:cytochrome P450